MKSVILIVIIIACGNKINTMDELGYWFSFGQLSDYELCVAANLLDPRSVEVTWGSIGGLDETIENIQETVILPFKRADLFRNSSLLQPPKGRSAFIYLY